MRSFTHKNNIKLRPHAKMHKSVEVAKYQLQYGNASGICCQKLSEAEVFVRSGIKDILITNQITDLKKIDRLCKINRSGSRVSCCVDNIGNLVSTIIGKQEELKIRDSIDILKSETKSNEDILNAEFSVIKENKNNNLNPRSHG